MKDWFLNLWQDIKDDPFGFILELLMVLLLIIVLFALFYSFCTGQLTSRDDKEMPMYIGKNFEMPMYIGKNLIFIQY